MIQSLTFNNRKTGDQFAAKQGGQFRLKQGGHLDRNLHPAQASTVRETLAEIKLMPDF